MDQLIRTSSFRKPNKSVIIQDGVLCFGKASISLDSVTGIRYGTEPIQVDMFYVGRRYSIDLKAGETNLKIVFKIIFGFKRDYFNNLFSDIINGIWQDTTVRLVEEYTNKLLDNADDMVIGKCSISLKGILLKGFLIEWNDLAYKKDYNKLVISSKSNPKVWTNLYYLENYNVDVLMAILDWIYVEDGLKEIEKARSLNSIMV